jgi:hypothetical protein
MKKAILLINLLFLTIASLAQNTTKNELIIKKLVIDSFNKMWSAMDTSKITKYHTQDFLLLENGEVWTNDSIANNFTSTLLREKIIPKRLNTIEFIDVKVSKDFAWVAYHNQAVWAIDEKIYGKARWLESAVAVKVNNIWKLQMLHSTSIKSK